ncbi:MAG: efflux RND transporter permease subunit [Gemmatimonadota bacterium]|jgi:HAE1 family hydrophobic/amphiphilic exporter-1|nr:efflux RND transporter permease subunit [Gemmatimonadota bacterium]
MIRFSIHRPVATAMVYFILSALGVVAWLSMPVEMLPDTQLPRFTISAGWPGASPEAMEAFVTAPIEATAQLVSGVENVSSVSTEGSASIVVDFHLGTDLEFARLDLVERLSALETTLPESASRPAVSPYVPPEFEAQLRPFLQYTVTGPYTTEELRGYTEDRVRAGLLAVEGVRAVEVTGGRERTVEVEIDEKQAAALGLSARSVRNRIAGLDDAREVGSVEISGLRNSVVVRDRAESLDALRQTVVLSDRGRIVRLGDIAMVRDAYGEAASHYRIDGQPAVRFTVVREGGTNAIEVADEVRERVDSLGTLLPAGTRIILDEDESVAIRQQFVDIRNRGFFSAIIIFVVLIAFLRSFQATVVVFATIALSALITLNLVYWAGLSLNMLTLMGLVMGFGLIDDNAIVVLENIHRLWKSGVPAGEATERGALEMVVPVIAGTLTTLVVVVPFVYLQGELRAYYVPMGIVVGACMLASLFVSFTFVPALAGTVLRGDARGAPLPAEPTQQPAAASAVTPGPEPRQTLYARFYTVLTGLTLRHPWKTVALTVAVLAGTGWIFVRDVPRDVLWRPWAYNPTYIAIEIVFPRGEELRRADEVVQSFERRLATMPEVSRFVASVGARRSSIRIEFPDSLRNGIAPLVAESRIKAHAASIGGPIVAISGFGPAFSAGGFSGDPTNYRIRVLGYNFEEVRRIADDIGRRMDGVDRIANVNVNFTGSNNTGDRSTEIVVRLDRAKVYALGLSMDDAQRQIHDAMSVRGDVNLGASSSGIVRVGDDRLPLAVRFAGYGDEDVGYLESLVLLRDDKEVAMLGEIATITERDVLTRVTRADQQYERIIAYQFRGPTRLGDAVQDALVESTTLPPGYTVIGRRESSFAAEDRRQLFSVMAVALLFIYLLTAGLYESFRLPFVVLLTVPMALIGVFAIFRLTNASFTREAYIGVIMMSGIVVNNAILLVDHISRLQRETTLPLVQVILSGSLDRVRPILMTTATSILGLLPLVLFSESPDANIWNAMGYALIGGLTSSTFLVLTVTPALYLLFERSGAVRAGID